MARLSETEIARISNELIASCHSMREEREHVRDFHRLACALGGDALATIEISSKAFEAVMRGEALTPDVRLWLAEMLAIVGNSRDIAIRIAKELNEEGRKGGSRPGATRKDWLAYHVSTEVANAILSNEAGSMEEAWALVAERRSVDASTVRGYWSKQKKWVYEEIEARNPGLKHLGGAEMLKQLAALNRTGRRAAS